MTTDRPTGPNASGRMVLAFMAFVLLVLFGGSFLYRMERPSLEVRQKESQAAMPDAMQQAMNGPMKEVLALMQRLKEHPDDPALQLTMAEKFMDMGSFERAKTFLDKVRQVRPDDPEVLNALGVTLYNLKDMAGAKDAFEAVLAHDAEDYRARFNLALLHKYALHEPGKAAEEFKAVLASPKADPETKATSQKELEGLAAQ